MNAAGKLRMHQTLVRAPRFNVRDRLAVASKTIGTKLTYHFMTDNVSSSGLLLSATSVAKVPYIINTILELTVNPDGNQLNRPLNFLAKVVRREDQKADSPERRHLHTRLGVQIIQIETDELAAWEKCVATVSKDALPANSVTAKTAS